ncbi:phytanoyl-CoA dioxygenase family protein [Engelhardtia mirabilis]|uniref:Phytanoyl-CoA dioxygenase (PhyH) n=1 Tax=Engelhardtia mirabilis TaxID=2528011 RepID=A0A518BSM5_9BACT|nr:Phytanoyl-CoA dioxygenase (PhyH) [Planctomycetes bacterium Pla133]QDV04295.1 Phytanoyl-CoA dioxygenase (PhyH) [Planctomycetes bacterium Pla86]
MPTSRELQSFAANGFHVVRGAFDPERVSALSDDLRAFEGLQTPDLPAESLASFTPVVDEYRLMNVTECGQRFLDLVDEPLFLDWCAALMPGDIRLTESFALTRRRGVGLPLHALALSGFEETPTGPRTRLLTLTVCLSDVGTDDGPFVALAGSHRRAEDFPYGRLHPDWPEPQFDREVSAAFRAQNEGRPQVRWEDLPGYTEVLVEAGDVVVLTQDLWHGAKALHSGRTRRTLYFTYGPYWFPNFHGLRTSREVFERASTVQRRLLGGPFVGNLYQGGPDVGVEPSAAFPFVPNSERDPARFRGGR